MSIDKNSDAFGAAFYGLFNKGLNVIDNDNTCTFEYDKEIIKTMLAEGYSSLHNRYKKIKGQTVGSWIEKQVSKYFAVVIRRGE